MKAVILAAGKGTRMKDLTQELPKPMLPVRGKPLLEYILERLIQAGFKQICLITGWRAETIESHFKDGAAWGVEVVYRRQEVQDGTGKAPELAKDFAGNDPFLLTYGDILVSGETYRQLRSRFDRGDAAAVVAVKQGEDVSKGGLNLFSAGFLLQKIVEKPTGQQLEGLKKEGWLRPGDPIWYNAGIYLFAPALFDYTARLEKSPRGEYELTDAIAGMLAGGHRIAGVEAARDWVDVRDPEILKNINK